MSDIVERARTAITTIGYAQMHGDGNAYPDSVIARLLAELIAEVERLRPRQIDTVEELDALPVHTIIRCAYRRVYEKWTSSKTLWWKVGTESSYKSARIPLPAQAWIPEAH